MCDTQSTHEAELHSNVHHRLCQPWITPTILRGTFGELAMDVAARFLVQHISGRYIFMQQYDRYSLFKQKSRGRALYDLLYIILPLRGAS